MKFNSLLDHRLFIRKAENSIKDSDFLLKLKACDGYEIPDEYYFLLTDSVASYMGQLKLHSGKKTFYKKLLRKELILDNLPNLYAVMTHLSIGLVQRQEIRNGVSTDAYSIIKDSVSGMVDALLSNEKVDNTLYDLLK